MPAGPGGEPLGNRPVAFAQPSNWELAMSGTSEPAPQFDSPPVVETVFGVHFKPLSGFAVAHQSLFWAEFADEFPNVEERHPLDEQREKFGDDAFLAGPEVRWQVSSRPPSPRLWAKSQDGRHTIQIQRDGLFTNWERDVNSQQPYLPFAKRREDFAEKLHKLSKFITEHKLGEVEPTTCFVTYVNHVELSAIADYAPTLQRVLTTWRNESSDGWLPSVDLATLQFSYPLPGQQGRLHVRAVPGVRRADNTSVLRLDLTGRVSLSEPTPSAALDGIDLGHDWVVRGFVSLTRPEMHKVWGRTQ